jgi:2-oxoglutarate ferredoxin oxidoreductase subunit delta
MQGKINIDKELCKGCELCIAACPKGLIQKGKTLNRSSYFSAEFVGNAEQCEGCALCATICPEVAIEVYRG